MYKPNPVNLDSIQLQNDLKQLVEQMAEQVHETWAQERMNAGWIYGEQRNDELKTHPCLVPYEALTESEKQYDRITAERTLKLVVSYGYEITKHMK